MIDFVVVAYRKRDELRELLDQLEQTVNYPYTVTVVDNTLRNRGWAEACNLGVAATAGSRSPLLGFLNTDLELHPRWLDPIIDAFDADALLAVAGPRCIDGLPWPRDIDGMTGWVCGAAMLVRRSVFTMLNGFDHRRFPHEYAETDFERRVEQQVLRVRTVETSEITHHWTPCTDPTALVMNAAGATNWQTAVPA